jgi:hypothetical protein
MFDDGIHVRKGQHESYRLAVDLGDAKQVLPDKRLHLLRDVADFAVGDRHEAPVLRPGVVEDAEDQVRLFLEAAAIGLADADAGILLARCDDAVDQRRKALVDLQIIGEKRLCLGIAELLDPALIMRRMMAHQNGRGMVMALHQ